MKEVELELAFSHEKQGKEEGDGGEARKVGWRKS